MTHPAKAGFPDQRTSALSYLIPSSSYLLSRWGQQKVQGIQGRIEDQHSDSRVLDESVSGSQDPLVFFFSSLFLLYIISTCLI